MCKMAYLIYSMLLSSKCQFHSQKGKTTWNVLIEMPKYTHSHTGDLWTPPVWTAQIYFKQTFFSKYLYCFGSIAGSLWVWWADCMHQSMPFYRGHLNIPGYWYMPGVLETNLCGYRGTTKFGGSQKLYANFRLFRGWSL